VRTEQKKNDEQPTSLIAEKSVPNPVSSPASTPNTTIAVTENGPSTPLNLVTESDAASYGAKQQGSAQPNNPEPAKPVLDEKSTKTTLAKNMSGSLGDLSISALKKSTASNASVVHEKPIEAATEKPDERAIPENITTENQPPVSREQLLIYWRGFAQRAKEEGKLSLFATLTNHDPELVGEQITFNVDNAVQQHDMDECRQDLVDHLCAGFKRTGMRLQINKIERDEKQEAYTPQEKYKRMAEKNPNIEKLRQQFDLDIDFG
jgi:DNA polymerase-3 subunit gamma/tau